MVRGESRKVGRSQMMQGLTLWFIECNFDSFLKPHGSTECFKLLWYDVICIF